MPCRSTFDELTINPTFFGMCHDCGLPRINFHWCKSCEMAFFRRQSRTWSETDNARLNDLLRTSQCNADLAGDFIDYIPQSQLDPYITDNNYPVSGAYSTVSMGMWYEGPRINWSDSNCEWEPTGPTKVALKRIHNSQAPDSNAFLEKATLYYKALQDTNVADTFGISLNPQNELVFVMKWYNEGNLYQALEAHQFKFEGKVQVLFGIANGLDSLHGYGLHHGNIHGGNILIDIDSGSITAKLADVGICGPANQHASTNVNGVFGVLPYVAPEVLLGNPLGKESDVYAFGVLMWQIATARRPCSDRPHDISLAAEIVRGNVNLSDISNLVSSEYIEMMEKCLHHNRDSRPTAAVINQWLSDYIETSIMVCNDMIDDYSDDDIHPKAYYTSRLLSYPQLRPSGY